MFLLFCDEDGSSEMYKLSFLVAMHFRKHCKNLFKMAVWEQKQLNCSYKNSFSSQSSKPFFVKVFCYVWLKNHIKMCKLPF
jgi:hypothetical protein